MYRTAVVVAALCVLAPVAAAASGPTATDRPAPAAGKEPAAVGSPSARLATPPNNTTAYLAIPPENVSNATTTDVALDVGGALAIDAAATRGTLLERTIDERLARANTTAAKQAAIRTVGARIERRIETLRVEQRTAIRAYEGGQLSTRAFVYTLARLQTRAVGLRGAIDRLESAAVAVPGTAIGGRSVDRWARDRRVELGLLAGPARRATVAALRGIDPAELYVEVSETGVVLAAIDDGRYVREAYLPAERDDGPPDGPERTSAALERVSTLYSWAWNRSTGVRSAGGPAAGSYRITVFHRQGRLTTYLDAGTGAVFRETQVKPLREVPTAPPVTAAETGLRVAVNRTYATGPMNVSVVDTRTGEPANATVLVDNRTAGRTGPDGSLWTITPRGTINVTVADGERAVTTRFASDPRLSTGENGSALAARRTPSIGNRPAAPETGAGGPANEPTGTDNGSTPLPGDRSTDVETDADASADIGTENGSNGSASATLANGRPALVTGREISACDARRTLI
jgi:hypothetical protein